MDVILLRLRTLEGGITVPKLAFASSPGKLDYLQRGQSMEKLVLDGTVIKAFKQAQRASPRRLDSHLL